MENSKKVQNSKVALETVENEINYFENAVLGLRIAFSLIEGILEHKREERMSLLPDREEVEE